MARTHAKVKCEIWNDDEWRELDCAAKAVYVMLLSQPRLSLIGALDYTPKRWAAWFPDLDEAGVDAAVRRLEAVGWVVVDEDTDELLIRTFARHDDLPASNKNLRSGLWSAWRSLASDTLRKVAADNVTDEQIGWDEAPVDAAQMRRSLRLEPQPRPRLEPPLDFIFQTVTESSYPPGTSRDNAEPVDSEHGGEVERVVNAVARQALAAKNAGNDPAANPDGWLAWWLQENAAGCRVRVAQLLEDYEGMSGSQLIAAATTTRGQAPPWMRQYARRTDGNVVAVEFGDAS